MRPNILIINASIAGGGGNTHKALSLLADYLREAASVNWIIINEGTSSAYYQDIIRQADGIIFGTGTYWDSWSSGLQRLLEDLTFWDQDVLFGKPASIIVTEHSCGGKSILSRLQGVLSSMGMLIPPMSGLVLSAAGQAAINGNIVIKEDIWSMLDLEVIAHNLLAAASKTWQWKKWNTDSEHTKENWLTSFAGLQVRLERTKL